MYGGAPDAELVKALIGAEAQAVSGLSLAALLDMQEPELRRLGLSRPARRRMLAGAEVARRYQPQANPPSTVTNAREAVARLGAIRALDHEALAVLMLDAQLRPIDVEVIAHGGFVKVAVGPADVFRPAVRAGASALVIAHNHPSGSLVASQDDLEFTRAMLAAGAILAIEVVDHIILAARGFKSLREAQLLQ